VRKSEIPAVTNVFPFEARSFSVRMKNTCRLHSATYDSVHTVSIPHNIYTLHSSYAGGLQALKFSFPLFPPNSSLSLTYSQYMTPIPFLR